MTDPVVFPIPERVAAVFVLAAPRHVSRDVKNVLSRQIDTPDGRLDLRVDVLTADTSPIPQLVEMLTSRDYGGPFSADLRRRIGRARWFVELQCSGPPTWPPMHLFRCVYLLQYEAILTGGLPIDLAGGWPVVKATRASALGGPFCFAVTDWIRVGAITGDAGLLTMRTVGLARLGCPELCVDRIPVELLTAWANVLNGLARKLLIGQWGILQDDPDQAFRQISNPVTLDTAIVEAAIDCGHDHPLASARLDLRYDIGHPDTGPLLHVTPPSTTRRTRPDWLRYMADRLGLCARD